MELFSIRHRKVKAVFDPVLSACWVASLFAISVSFWLELVGNVSPCTLCNLQRIPYIFVCLFAPIGISLRFHKIARSVVVICFLAGLVLASVHLAVQAGILSDFCSVPQNIDSLENFQRMIYRSGSCTQNSWKFLGISLSEYNLVVSFLLLFLSFKKWMPLSYVRS